ncbi:hypothetical protein EAY64_05455 [Aquitalea palustris]|uniref:Uncharacterized protein n=1 Tax=Aquitalea palustris TaxID=2480983 RepID=A0A454JKW8_9NEIS|nr:hypothetical protein [Aquitalea palustris]RMD00043.1 hypothetical protein EAY64_05455 [Aquitalea palustris]
MYLKNLNNTELLRTADQLRDPLTSTDMELELIERFAPLLDKAEQLSAIEEKLLDLGIEDTNWLTELLSVLASNDITDCEKLIYKLRTHSALYDLVREDEELPAQLEELAKAPEIQLTTVYNLQDHAASLTKLAELTTTLL